MIYHQFSIPVSLRFQYVYFNHTTGKFKYKVFSLDQIEKLQKDQLQDLYATKGFKCIARRRHVVTSNGIDVWEWDVIADSSNMDNGWNSIIIFDEFNFFLKRSHPGARDLWELYERNRITVIGNAFTHPDLA